jgi:hypothetical protein
MRGLFLVAMLAVAGCKQAPKPGTPDASYVAFVTSLQRGDAKTAWSLLTPSTKDVVTAKSKAIAEASHGTVRDEPEVLLFQAGRAGAVGEIKTLSDDGERAVLKVASAGGEQEVKLVKNSGRWLIDLSDQLK